MAKDSTTTWVCDRSSDTLTLPVGENPPGWSGVLQVQPPEARDPGATRKHLCAECTLELATWLEPVTP